MVLILGGVGEDRNDGLAPRANLPEGVDAGEPDSPVRIRLYSFDQRVGRLVGFGREGVDSPGGEVSRVRMPVTESRIPCGSSWA